MQIRLIIAVAAYGVLATAILRPPPVLAGSGTEAFDRDMQPVLASYLNIQEQLAADFLDGVGAGATALAQTAAKLDAGSVTGEHAAHYKDVPANVRGAAQALSKAPDINAARDAFKQLSQPMAMWATMSHPDGVDVLFCSMAKASWLQKHGEVRNPYYGAASLRCGEVLASTAPPAEMHHERHSERHRAH